MTAEELFRANLSLIDRVIGRICHRARLQGADAEDFASAVKLHLIEDNYAVLQAFEGRCTLATYLTIVVQRFLSTERMKAWGRWHDSTEAKRMGDAGVLLEQLVRRDGRSIDEALPLVRDVDPRLTRDDVVAMVERLPERRPRLRAVTPEDVEYELPPSVESAETDALSTDNRRISERTSHIIKTVLESLSLEDRALLRLRFDSSLSIADIARTLQIPQRPLYRRLERLLRDLRHALVAGGVDERSIENLIGSDGPDMDFGLRDGEKPTASQSMVDGAEL